MSRLDVTDSFGRRWYGAPYQSEQPTTGSIQGVWLRDNEEVEWIWSHGPGGSRITGYKVTEKKPPEVLKRQRCPQNRFFERCGGCTWQKGEDTG